MGYNLAGSCNLQNWISVCYWVKEMASWTRHDEMCEMNAKTQSKLGLKVSCILWTHCSIITATFRSPTLVLLLSLLQVFRILASGFTYCVSPHLRVFHETPTMQVANSQHATTILHSSPQIMWLMSLFNVDKFYNFHISNFLLMLHTSGWCAGNSVHTTIWETIKYSNIFHEISHTCRKSV